MEIAGYIIDTNATVRQAAKQFGISKSTVHSDVTKWNGSRTERKEAKIFFVKRLA